MVLYDTGRPISKTSLTSSCQIGTEIRDASARERFEAMHENALTELTFRSPTEECMKRGSFQPVPLSRTTLLLSFDPVGTQEVKFKACVILIL